MKVEAFQIKNSGQKAFAINDCFVEMVTLILSTDLFH